MNDQKTTRIAIVPEHPSVGGKERLDFFGDLQDAEEFLRRRGLTRTEKSGDYVVRLVLPNASVISGEARRIHEEIRSINPPVAKPYNPGHGAGSSAYDSLITDDSWS